MQTTTKTYIRIDEFTVASQQPIKLGDKTGGIIHRALLLSVRACLEELLERASVDPEEASFLLLLQVDLELPETDRVEVLILLVFRVVSHQVLPDLEARVKPDFNFAVLFLPFAG